MRVRSSRSSSGRSEIRRKRSHSGSFDGGHGICSCGGGNSSCGGGNSSCGGGNSSCAGVGGTYARLSPSDPRSSSCWIKNTTP